MRVGVVEHHTGKERTFVGSRYEVAADLVHAYPCLLAADSREPEELCAALNRRQAYSAAVLPEDSGLGDLVLHDVRKSSAVDDQLGSDDAWARLLRAAAALAPGTDFLEHPPRPGEDPEGDALRAAGVQDTAENRKALRALADLQKSETDRKTGGAVKVETVAPTSPAGEPFAESVRRASAAGQLRRLSLGEGRHSSGTLQAVDPETGRVLLLKPNDGLGPARGEHDTAATPARREAAFYDCAQVFGEGCGDAVPECRLLLLDGAEYAALAMLHDGWRNCNQLRAENEPGVRRVLALYHSYGFLHRWAAMDFVLGQTDRNAGNVMIRDTDVALIDAGAAFAGAGFSPATDPAVWVPYYLRALAPGDFQSTSLDLRFRALPRLHADKAAELADWLRGVCVNSDDLAAALIQYGIDPVPYVARLARMRWLLEQSPADIIINAAWTLP